jgi:hypothetical protein
VRTSFAVWFLLTAALCCVHAQDQEKKLVDRLLKPDMTLQNDVQNKKFIGDGSASINKRANVGTFYVHQKPRSKNYSGTRDFSTTQFYSQTYRGGRTAHEVSSQQTLTNSKSTYASQTARGVRDAPQSEVAQQTKRAAHDRAGARVVKQKQVALVRPRRVRYSVTDHATGRSTCIVETRLGADHQ